MLRTKVIVKKLLRKYLFEQISNLNADLQNYNNYNNIVLCGGGINEFLKEVEIALQVLNKHYTVLTKYTY